MPHSMKAEAGQRVRSLPEEASWYLLMYEIYVRQKIEQGVRAAAEGRVVSHEEVRRVFRSVDEHRLDLARFRFVAGHPRLHCP